MSRLISYIKNKFKQRTLRSLYPKMVYGIHHKGKFLADTRLGNTTTIIMPENLELENNVFIGQYNFIEASNNVTIEEGVQITNYISVLTHSSHISIRLYGEEYRNVKHPVGYKKGSVKIGKYTFIGPHSTIMPGTKIGKGCLVSAYSMVKGDIPDFAIVSGNPAKISGTTKDLDKNYLEKHPELEGFYRAWAE